MPSNWANNWNASPADLGIERFGSPGACSTDHVRAVDGGVEAKQLKGANALDHRAGSGNGIGLSGHHKHLRSLKAGLRAPSRRREASAYGKRQRTHRAVHPLAGAPLEPSINDQGPPGPFSAC